MSEDSCEACLLRLVANEPGEHTASDLVQLLNLSNREVGLAVRRMTRKGSILARGLRLHHGVQQCSEKVPDGLLRRIYMLVEEHPGISRAKLAAVLGIPPKNGNLNRALKDLHLYGYVAHARALWPAEVQAA